MSAVRVGCVVEGHGDTAAVPVLVRRIAADLDPTLIVQVERPLRVPRSRLVRGGELEATIARVVGQLGGQGGVLVLVDSDDDCPARLGPELLRRASAARADVPLAVVLAKPEFEAWFLAAAESLRGQRGLPGDLQAPPDPEAIRDAKGWLTQHLPRGRPYVETLHQPGFAARFDLVAARRAPSFDKCYRDVERLLRELKA